MGFNVTIKLNRNNQFISKTPVDITRRTIERLSSVVKKCSFKNNNPLDVELYSQKSRAHRMGSTTKE